MLLWQSGSGWEVMGLQTSGGVIRDRLLEPAAVGGCRRRT